MKGRLFGQRLRMLREKREMTQEEMSGMLHVHRSTYTKYEIGETQPSIDTLIRLADLFKVSVDFLLGRTDDPRPRQPVRQ